MAIVEDEVRNESEEENEIEVVVEEYDCDQDSDDDSDDDEEEVLETKVAELERRVAKDPLNYDDHIELIQALWGLSELDRWRAAFDNLQQLMLLRPEHWLLRLQTEMSLAHSDQARERIKELFNQATLDCYSIPILTEWCSWSVGAGIETARKHIDEVVRRAGADPLSGKLFWDCKAGLEKARLEDLSEDDPSYKEQLELVLFCLEETVSRPLLHGDEVWPQLEEIALKVHNQEYLDRVKKQHEAATDYLQQITKYEDKLLTLDDQEEKLKVYQDYIEKVKELSRLKEFAECDNDGILRVLYDRATSECTSDIDGLLSDWARHVQRTGSRAAYRRVASAAVRRRPRRAAYWLLLMRAVEADGGSFDEIKTILETALAKGLDTYKDSEDLWMAYLEYVRRHTQFDNEQEVERLRRTFRLSWDSLAAVWDSEANDCEIPLYWARLEYKRIGDAKQGKEIFEEIFKYGENKTMSKYWEAFISLESKKSPPLSENKLRELHRRALKFVTDYPPAIARLYTDMERDFGSLDSMKQCVEECEAKLKEWRDNYQAMKEKMMGNKQKGKQNKKTNVDNKNKKKDEPKSQSKNKRKADDGVGGSEVKKKKDSNMDVDTTEKNSKTNEALKRTHEDDSSDATEVKRQRIDSEDDHTAPREACTLFVSNLEFKVDETKLRDKLSEYGEIVSLRVRAGVKAFGGSICYCQYKTTSSVDEALRHDRTPLEGRPMFFSRYSAKKGGKTFKYATTAEKNKLFVRNLPFGHCTKEALTEVFEQHGKLKDIRVVTFKDGKPKGLAYIEYEDDESASKALEKTNGLLVGDRKIDVAISAPPVKDAPTSLGLPKRDNSGGMRRTQLSSFIPSVLQRPSTSKAATNGTHTNGDEKRPLSNTDFRNMLLNK